MPSIDRLRPWLLLVAVALIAVLAMALLLRRGSRGPAEAEVEAEEDAPARAPSRTRRPPRFDDAKALRGQVAELNAELERVRAAQARAKREEERACLTSVSDKCPFLDPTPEALVEMARCGIVRMDMPDMEATEAQANEQGQVDEEAEAIAQATREINGQVRDDLRSLHADLGLAGEPALKMRDLLDEVEAGLPRADGPDVRRQIARERAGLAAPPPAEGQSVSERYWRMRAAIGDQYESTLARKLGPARARALRKAKDGWPMRGIYTGQCLGDGGF